ncbi:MAG: DUF1616 domain-containing protein [Patescibacteria group bacterium]
MKKNELIISLVSFGFLVLIAFILSFFLTLSEAFRLVFGTMFILFIPGFAWSWIFWKRGSIDAIERGTLSIALSIAFVPLTTYLLFKAGIAISLFNVLIEVAGLIIAAIVIKYYADKKEKRLGFKKP